MDLTLELLDQIEADLKLEKPNLLLEIEKGHIFRFRIDGRKIIDLLYIY